MARKSTIPFVALCLASGCTTTIDDTSASPSSGVTIEASSQTRAELGVQTWESYVASDGAQVIDGRTATGARVVSFDARANPQADPIFVAHLHTKTIAADLAVVTGLSSSDVNVTTNTFDANAHHVLERIIADLSAQGSTGPSLSTGPGPGLSTGPGPSLTATTLGPRSNDLAGGDTPDLAGGDPDLTPCASASARSGLSAAKGASKCGSTGCTANDVAGVSGDQNSATGQCPPLTCVNSGKNTELAVVWAFTEHCGYSLNRLPVHGALTLFAVDPQGPLQGGWQHQDEKCRFEAIVVVVDQHDTSNRRVHLLAGGSLLHEPRYIREVATTSFYIQSYQLTAIDPNGCRSTQNRQLDRCLWTGDGVCQDGEADSEPCPFEPVCQGNAPGTFTPAQECYDAQKPYIHSQADLEKALRYCGCEMNCNRH